MNIEKALNIELAELSWLKITSSQVVSSSKQSENTVWIEDKKEGCLVHPFNPSEIWNDLMPIVVDLGINYEKHQNNFVAYKKIYMNGILSHRIQSDDKELQLAMVKCCIKVLKKINRAGGGCDATIKMIDHYDHYEIG